MTPKKQLVKLYINGVGGFMSTYGNDIFEIVNRLYFEYPDEETRHLIKTNISLLTSTSLVDLTKAEHLDDNKMVFYIKEFDENLTIMIT